MKQLSRLTVMILVVCLCACEPFSYREDYTGNFRFVTTRTLVNATTPDTTITTYDGSVKLYSKHGLLVHFKENDSIAPDVDKEGVLTVPGFVAEGGTFEGSYTDVDHLGFVSEFSSFTGDRVHYVVTGERR